MTFQFPESNLGLKLQEIGRNKSKVRAANSIFQNGPKPQNLVQFYHLLKLLSSLESSCEKVYKAGDFKGKIAYSESDPLHNLSKLFRRPFQAYSNTPKTQ